MPPRRYAQIIVLVSSIRTIAGFETEEFVDVSDLHTTPQELLFLVLGSRVS